MQLVQARRVPGCSATFLKARVDTGVLPSGAVVFEPSRDWLNDTGLYMEESVLRTDPEGYVYVLVQNPTAIPRQIGAGSIVGKAEELGHVVEPEELVGGSEAEVECMDGVGLPEGMAEVVEKATGDSEQPVCRVESGRVESGVDARKEMLEKLIKVSGEGLTTDEKQSIQDCVVDAHGIFALSELERGEVVEIMHEIDTGDSRPIRQPPRQVPFFLRPKISKICSGPVWWRSPRAHGLVRWRW